MRQVAFVSGHHMQDHILLAYELIRMYNTKGGAPRCMCMLQMDLQKSYDKLDLREVEDILKEFNFSKKLIKWIMIIY